MKLQPVNQNNTLGNHHAYAVGGKTSVAKKLFVKDTDQVVIFDPLNGYQGKLSGRVVRSYSNLRDFAIAVLAGRKTKQGFKIAYYPKCETTEEDFDRFCSIAWGVGDGKHAKPIKVICEEVAEHSHTTDYHGKLLRLGRKYNIHTIKYVSTWAGSIKDDH